jgi:hypothetical protein
MPSLTSFSKDSYLGTISFTENLINNLQPFILDVADKVQTTGQLEGAVMSAVERYPIAESYFNIEPGNVENSFGLKINYIFPDTNPIEYLNFIKRHTKQKLQIKLKSEGLLPNLHDLIYHCSSGLYSERQLQDYFEGPLLSLFNKLLVNDVISLKEPTALNFTSHETPGIFRLQHASLLYRTNASGILVDPHLHSDYELYADKLGKTISRSDLEGKVDGILISHSHTDHWHLSTLMMFPPGTPIVVPKVPKASIICDDMQQKLNSLGFTNVIAVDWYSEPFFIGDIEVNVLPFYGEQPLLYEHLAYPDLRNWGNTYLLRTEYYTSWFLIDSGNDATGTMSEVADYVYKKFGIIDVLLSNLREFGIVSPRYITGGSYWLSLSSEKIKDFSSMQGHCITLGPEGVAEISQTVKARYYLPYAHWWNNLGCPGDDESHYLRRLEQAMQDCDCDTTIVPWTIGDGFVLSGHHHFNIVRSY